MHYFELTPPADMAMPHALAFLQRSYERTVEEGFIDFTVCPREKLVLEVKTGDAELSIIERDLAKKGFGLTTKPHKPIGYSMNNDWVVSVSLRAGGNRPKYLIYDKSELEQEFAVEISQGMRIGCGKSKNMFFVTFNGRSMPTDFRQRMAVFGNAAIGKARPANYYYGPKLERTLP